MIVGKSSAVIKQPVEQVFQFVVLEFAKNYRRWSPEVQRLEVLTNGPLRVGTRARQIRVDQGRRSDTCFQVTALQPMQKVCFSEISRKFQGEYSMQSQEGGTELRFEFRLNKVDLFMRPFEKLIRIAIQDGAERTVHNIKRLVETERSSEQ
jgi:hypothetical protein